MDQGALGRSQSAPEVLCAVLVRGGGAGSLSHATGNCSTATAPRRRDRIVPHALSWFTGEALQEEFEDSDDEEGDEDEEDDDEEVSCAPLGSVRFERIWN